MGTLLHMLGGRMLLKTLHILSPAAVTVVYLLSSLSSFFGGKNQKRHEEGGPRRSYRVTYVALTTLILATYIVESIILTCALPTHAATTSDDNLVFGLFSSLVWLVLLLGLIDSDTTDIRRIFLVPWILALALETALLALVILIPGLSGAARLSQLLCHTSRIVLLIALTGITCGRHLTRHHETAGDEEIAPLLARMEDHLNSSGGVHANGNVYGTNPTNNSKNSKDGKNAGQQKNKDEYEDSDDEDDDNAENGRLKKDWWVYTKAFGIFLPHLWPRESIRLQLHFPALVLCLLACRALNVLAPLQLGIIVNVLGAPGGSVPWVAIGLFILLRFLDSSAGISLVQSWLWLPINRYTTEQLSSAAYDKVMNLSSDFHDSKKSGRMWRIVARGESLADLVFTIAFEMIPMAADLVIAVSVFWWLFDAYMAFIVALSSVVFLWSTAKTIPMKTKRQREVIKAWEDEYSQMTETSLNWTTVSYFNRISYEQNRYKAAVSNSQSKLITYRALSFIVSAMRALTLQTGLMGAAILAAFQISEGSRNVGEFVVLITYWAQLSTPLSFFANGFSKIAKSLVDAEKLLELLQTQPSVGNHEGATEFVLKQGQVDFDRVSFSYDGKRQVVNNLSFRAEPGQTVALVGETGGGKSTILKLLFRFYDATDGSVMIDGQDVRHVTLESLRSNIGCVPQDPVLFNQTIMQNLRYAKLDASEEEVQAACKAVALHEKIVSFTKGYSEKVGERGVKLSGGELQRMAIARAILKDPKILLLDEATSSVDSETEAVIQKSLKELCAGRTTFVVAHRLSTIVHADLVMVIKDGRIIERGTHDKLMKLSGQYSKLWTRQLKLESGQERSRSRARSPEKTTVLVDDVTDSDIGSRKALLTQNKHENRGSEDEYGSSGPETDGKETTGPFLDSRVRGRSPNGNNKAGEKFDSMRSKILRSKSPAHKEQNGHRERKSQSHSPLRTSLKPDAPEFVPQNLRSGMPQSSWAVPAVMETQNTGTGLDVSNGPMTSQSPITSTSSSSAESYVSEGASPQDLSEPIKPDRRRGEGTIQQSGRQIYNSRRNISKSDPQGWNQIDAQSQAAEQTAEMHHGTFAASELYAGPGPGNQSSRQARRRSSAPNVTVSSINGAGQLNGMNPSNGYGTPDGPNRLAPSSASRGRDARRSNFEVGPDLGEGDEDRRIIAPANSPATEKKP